jgi:hypothetical protein
MNSIHTIFFLNGGTSDLSSEGAWLEIRQVEQIHLLRIFIVFLSSHVSSFELYHCVLPFLLQFIIYIQSFDAMLPGDQNRH